MHATMTEYDRTEGKGDAGNNYLCKVHAVNIGYQYPHVTINNTLYHVAGKQPSYLILLNSKWSKCRAPLVTMLAAPAPRSHSRREVSEEAP